MTCEQKEQIEALERDIEESAELVDARAQERIRGDYEKRLDSIGNEW